MAALRKFTSLAHDDEQLWDMAKARAGLGGDDLPEYPPGLRFTVRECCFERLGIDGTVQPGATVKFAAMARATSVNRRTDGCRVEAEIDMLALDDGEFADLEEGMRPSICLNEADHERLDIEDTAERGDLLHLQGTVRVESTDDPSWGDKSITFQILEGMVAEIEDGEAI